MNRTTTSQEGQGRGEPPGESFPATSRLLKRSEFKMVQERGLRYAGAALVLLALPTALRWRRLGLTVSRKVGNAVCRGRVKRRLRDIFRKERACLPPSVDLVVIARAPAADATREALLKEFTRAAAFFRRALADRQREGGAP
jgi:ribonuclease P protein component